MGLLKDMFWPWGALAEAREQVRETKAFAHKCLGQTNGVEQANASLRTLIREGHFRKPETGRLGRKGEVPIALQRKFGVKV